MKEQLSDTIDKYLNKEMSPEERLRFQAEQATNEEVSTLFIEEYLGGKMSAAERRQFESELATHPELSSLLQAYRAIETEMRAPRATGPEEEDALRRTLEQLNAHYFKTEEAGGRVRTMNFRSLVAVAAVLLLCLSAGIFWWASRQEQQHPAGAVAARDKEEALPRKENAPDQVPLAAAPEVPGPALTDTDRTAVSPRKKRPVQKVQKRKMSPRPQPQPEDLFASNFYPDTLFASIATLWKDDDWGLVVTEFNNKNYGNTIARIDESRTRFSPDDWEEEMRGGGEDEKKVKVFYGPYYKGQSYLALGQAEKAIPELETALKVEDETLQSKARWYLALAYLKANRQEEARTLLQQLADRPEEEAYQQEAKKLLKELN